jgi:chloramphenicol-sensitive protein RarD
MYDASMTANINDTTESITEGQRGAALGLSAYLIWGCFPLFFKAISSVPAAEVVAHRIIWSATFLLLFIAVTGAGKQFVATLRDRRTLAVLALTTLLISVNWFIFISAVISGNVLESSLGYYINPLVSVFLGFMFLRERLTPRQWVSIVLAAAGVIIQTIMLGKVPVVSLILAVTFGLYGLVRKAAKVPAVKGLAVEMILMSPLMLIYMAHLFISGKAHFLSGNTRIDVLLVLAGLVTSIPLILYGMALNSMRLSTLGIMQYIVPTAHFGWAVFAFGEKFTMAHMVSFGFIWAGLVLYTSETLGVMKLKPATQAAGQVAEDKAGRSA